MAERAAQRMTAGGGRRERPAGRHPEPSSRAPPACAARSTRLLAQGDADAVLIADGRASRCRGMPVLRAASPQPRLLGTELWASEGNLGANVALRGGLVRGAVRHASSTSSAPATAPATTASPYRLASLGYDAVLLTVRIAANWPVRRDASRPARCAIPTGFAGVDGAFRFGRDGVAERALEVREVTATGTTVVSPAPRGFD